MINEKSVLDHKNYTKHQNNVTFILFMPLKCHYFSASSLSTLMHLPDFRMSLKIQPRQKSGSCIRNHSRTAISTSSLTLNQRHLCAALIFQRSFSFHAVFISISDVLGWPVQSTSRVSAQSFSNSHHHSLTGAL